MSEDKTEFVREKFMRKIIPTEGIVDYSVLSGPLSTKEGFRSEVEKLIEDEELPIYFPNKPDFFKARNQGVATNKEYIDKELTLPKIFYNSDTYNAKLVLRGPLEEIIYAYELERKKQGLEMNHLKGDNWSEGFRKRMKTLPTAHISWRELARDLVDPDDDLPKKLKGKKIA